MVDKGKRVEAVGYMRTSSAANVGDGKDSEARQRKAIECYRLSRRTAAPSGYCDQANARARVFLEFA